MLPGVPMKRNMHLWLVLLVCSSMMTTQSMENVADAEAVRLQAVKERWRGQEDRFGHLMNEASTHGFTEYCWGSVIIAEFDSRAGTVTTYLRDDKRDSVVLGFDQFLALFGKTIGELKPEGAPVEFSFDDAYLAQLDSAGLREEFLTILTTLKPALAEELKNTKKMETFIRKFVAQHKVCVACSAKNCTKLCACRQMAYCSVACQKNDWPRHRPECTYAKK